MNGAWILLLQTKSFLNSIGEDPIRDDPKTGKLTVEGEGTDHVVNDDEMTPTRNNRKRLKVTPIGMIVTAIALISCIAGMSTLYVIPVVWFQFSSLLVAITGPIVLWQRRTLRKLGTFRQQHNQMRQRIVYMSTDIQRLQETIQQLEIHSAKLDAVRSKLEQVAAASGAQVNRLMEICEEQANIHVQMRKQLQAQVLQQIMAAVLLTDKNRDHYLEGPELEVLIQRLRHMPSVEFHEDVFRNLVAKEPFSGKLAITDIAELVRNMDCDLLDRSKAIFAFKHVENETIVGGR